MQNACQFACRIAVVGATAALAAGGTAALAAAPKTGTFTGKSAQGLKVKAKVARSHKHLRLTLTGSYSAKCDDGSVYTGSISGRSPISRKGGFSIQGVGSRGVNGTEIDTAVVSKGHFTSRKRAVGSFDVNVQFYDANFKKTNECDSGKVKFTVKR